jgi:hypothetical protein
MSPRVVIGSARPLGVYGRTVPDESTVQRTWSDDRTNNRS